MSPGTIALACASWWILGACGPSKPDPKDAKSTDDAAADRLPSDDRAPSPDGAPDRAPDTGVPDLKPDTAPDAGADRPSLPSYLSVWGAGPQDIWVGDSEGRLRHWNGAGWSEPMNVANRQIRAIWGASGSDVWASATSQLLHYDGTSWQPRAVPNRSLFLNTVHGSAANDVWAAGQLGLVLHWDGNGWSERSIGGLNDVQGLWARTPTDVWAAADTVHRWNGSGWTTVAVSVQRGARSAYAAAANDVWIGAKGPYHFDGANWGLSREWNESDLLRPNVTALWGLGAASVWAVTPFAVYHYDGQGWSVAFRVTPQTNLRAVWSGAGVTWVVGDDGTLQRL